MTKELDELFTEWAKKGRHQGQLFNRDGIVDEKEWNEVNKKILFLNKEAYHKEQIYCETYDLAEDLYKNGPWNNIWHRVAEWARAVLLTEKNRIPSYQRLKPEEANMYLRKIAVMNIKKSDGNPSSKYSDLCDYAKEDSSELMRELEIIDPDIIVCGYTFDYLNIVLGSKGESIDKTSNYNENYHYKWRDKTIIDYYHPSAHMNALQSFYGLVGSYHDSLLE